MVIDSFKGIQVQLGVEVVQAIPESSQSGYPFQFSFLLGV
jgi:hypothetical protein